MNFRPMFRPRRPMRAAAMLEDASEPATPSPIASGADLVALLCELKSLVDEGVLTRQEFDVAKRQLLAP